MSKFDDTDPEVQQIAGMFAVSKWKWAVKDAHKVPPFVPTAADIARSLNRLYDSALWPLRNHKCAVCEKGDYEYCAERPHGGSARSGRLFVEWNDSDGYGKEVRYGIDWSRGPFDGMGYE